MESLLQKVYDFPCHKSAIIKVYFLPHFKITKNNLSNNNNKKTQMYQIWLLTRPFWKQLGTLASPFFVAPQSLKWSSRDG